MCLWRPLLTTQPARIVAQVTCGRKNRRRCPPPAGVGAEYVPWVAPAAGAEPEPEVGVVGQLLATVRSWFGGGGGGDAAPAAKL